jgi:hypothetical protein
MYASQEVRERETQIDMELAPIESKYALLVKYETRIDTDELGLLASWQDAWQRVVRMARTASEELNKKQESLRAELVRNVQAFATEVRAFRKDFILHGPVEQGIKPPEVGMLASMQSLCTCIHVHAYIQIH